MATTQQQIDSTTQQFLDIYDITNDLVILKDGTTSLIITVDAMNFGLLAEEEQDSIMYAYAGLLNSLNYPIQIVIRSQTKDVTGYLRLLKEQEDAAVNRVQQQRIMKYREFVSNLIRERNVLDKKFFVSIPAKPLELGLVPVSSVIPGQAQTDVSTVDKSVLIEKARSILEPKRDHLIAQFARIGLYSRQLETQEIIQLFYQSYNPEAFEGQTMGDSKTYTTPLVSASIEDDSMNTQNQPPVDQTMAQPVSATAPTMDAASTAIPQSPTMTEAPTTPATEPTPINQAETPAQTTPQAAPNLAYTPTQMTSTEATPTIPAVQPATMPTQSPTTTPTSTTNTPLPPAPELPKINPGQTDPTVPKETEIEIKHVGENTTTAPLSTQPDIATPSESAASPSDSTPSASEPPATASTPTPSTTMGSADTSQPAAPKETAPAAQPATPATPAADAPMPPLPEIQ